MSDRQPDNPVQILLSPDEALVFYNWLARVNKSEELRFEHQAEQRVLWDIECILETKLVEPFKPDYDAFVQSARDSIADPEVEDLLPRTVMTGVACAARSRAPTAADRRKNRYRASTR